VDKNKEQKKLGVCYLSLGTLFWAILFIIWTYLPEGENGIYEIIQLLKNFNFKGAWMTLNILLSTYIGLALLFKHSLRNIFGKILLVMAFALVVLDVMPIVVWINGYFISSSQAGDPWMIIILIIHGYLLYQLFVVSKSFYSDPK